MQLPDGTEIQVGPDRFGIPEVLFKTVGAAGVASKIDACKSEETVCPLILISGQACPHCTAVALLAG